MSEHYSTSIESVAVGTTVAASDPIRYGAYASGMVYVPAGTSLTTLTWHACETVDGTYLAVEDESSTAETSTVAASQAHPIPASLLGARFIKVTGNATGTLGVTLKD